MNISQYDSRVNTLPGTHVSLHILNEKGECLIPRWQEAPWKQYVTVPVVRGDNVFFVFSNIGHVMGISEARVLLHGQGIMPQPMFDFGKKPGVLIAKIPVLFDQQVVSATGYALIHFRKDDDRRSDMSGQVKKSTVPYVLHGDVRFAQTRNIRVQNGQPDAFTVFFDIQPSRRGLKKNWQPQ